MPCCLDVGTHILAVHSETWQELSICKFQVTTPAMLVRISMPKNVDS
jgi:hypothetical protein